MDIRIASPGNEESFSDGGEPGNTSRTFEGKLSNTLTLMHQRPYQIIRTGTLSRRHSETFRKER